MSVGGQFIKKNTITTFHVGGFWVAFLVSEILPLFIILFQSESAQKFYASRD